MIADLVRIAFMNALHLLVGLGLGALVGLVGSARATWGRVFGAYLLGLAAVGIVSTYLAVLGVALGWLGMLLLAVVAVAAGAVRLVRAPNAPSVRLPSRSWPEQAVALGLFGIAVVVVGWGLRTAAVRPLVEWDGWAMWALKASVLYELPDDAAAVLRDPDYGQSTYPLVMPSLEAIAFRALGDFDGGLADVQLVGLVFGLVGAMWAILRDVCSPVLIGLAVLAIVSAPHFLYQLSWNYADVPLAIFVGAGVTCCGRWLAGDAAETWPLACAVAFLGAGGLTKNEGLLFAAAAAVALVVASAGGPRLLRSLIAAAAVAAVVLPWRLYTSLYDLRVAEYRLSDALDVGLLRERSDRVRPTLAELWGQLTNDGYFGFLLPAFAASLVAAFAARRFRLAGFAALWAALSFAGLVLTYWISVHAVDERLGESSYRVVMSLLVGGACLVPLLLAEAPAAVRAAWPPLRRRVGGRLERRRDLHAELAVVADPELEG